MTDRVSISDLAGRLMRGPAGRALERGVHRSTTAAELCRRLDGRVLQVDGGSESLAAHFLVTAGRLAMEPGYHGDPDATLTGSPLSLARMSGPDPQRVIREGDVTISGDAEVAEQFQYLLELVRLTLKRSCRASPGMRLRMRRGRFARGLAGWADNAGRSLGRSVAEYLTEESQALVTRVEADEFCADVDTLSADVDRLEARLRILRA